MRNLRSCCKELKFNLMEVYQNYQTINASNLRKESASMSENIFNKTGQNLAGGTNMY